MDNSPFFGENPNEEDNGDDVDDYGMRVGTDIIVRNNEPENRQLVQYNAEYENLLRSAEQIARNRIATNTRNQYNKANINFIYWVFYYHKVILKPEYIELFTKAREEGQDVYLKKVIEQMATEQEKCPLNLAKVAASSFFFLLTHI